MSHTPEPWELAEFAAPLDDWTGARYVIRQYKAAPGGIVLVLGGLGVQEERDNAHLVTAAPRLLSALRYVLPLLEAKDREEGGLGAYVREVRAAIVEATEGHL